MVQKSAIVSRGPHLPYFIRRLNEGEVLTDRDGNVVGAEEVMVYIGEVTQPSDFPPPPGAEIEGQHVGVQVGFVYETAVDVTDDDPARTNTGQTLDAGSVFFWNGTDWTVCSGPIPEGVLIWKGDVAVAADFPDPAEVATGWMFRCVANVTDNDPSKTNTGQSFNSGDEIIWNGTNWSSTQMPLPADVVTALATLTADQVTVGNGGNVVKPLAAGTNGQVLTMTGGVPAWQAPPAGGAPGGADTQLQFNDSGSFGGMPGVTWDGSTLGLTASATLNPLGAGANSVRIGAGSHAGTNGVAFGSNAAQTGGGIGNTLVGRSTSTAFNVSYNTLLGYNAVGGHNSVVAVGKGANASGYRAVAMGGFGSSATTRGVAIGSDADVTGAYGVALGDGAKAAGATFTVGATNRVSSFAFGTGSHNVTVANPLILSNFAVTPPAAPTADYQVANKKYVDDNAGGNVASDEVTGSNTTPNGTIKLIIDGNVHWVVTAASQN